MGVRRTLDPLLSPPIFSEHMSAESPSNISPIPLEVISEVRNPRKTFDNTPLCPPKYSIVLGLGGVPNFLIRILIFLSVSSPCKISEPYDNTFWDFKIGGQKKWKFPIAPMGFSLSCLCTRDSPLGPPSALGEIFWGTSLQSHVQTLRI
jgi:hypothetical protein